MLAILILFVYLVVLATYWNGKVNYYQKTNAGKLPPANTPEGKRERLIAIGLLISTIVVVALAAFGSDLGSEQAVNTILIFFSIAIIGFAVRTGTRKK